LKETEERKIEYLVLKWDSPLVGGVAGADVAEFVFDVQMRDEGGGGVLYEVKGRGGCDGSEAKRREIGAKVGGGDDDVAGDGLAGGGDFGSGGSLD
jgi:hypothetical protein